MTVKFRRLLKLIQSQNPYIEGYRQVPKVIRVLTFDLSNFKWHRVLLTLGCFYSHDLKARGVKNLFFTKISVKKQCPFTFNKLFCWVDNKSKGVWHAMRFDNFLISKSEREIWGLGSAEQGIFLSVLMIILKPLKD